MKRTLQQVALTEDEFLEEVKRVRVQHEEEIKELEKSTSTPLKTIDDKKRNLEKLKVEKDVCFVCEEPFAVVHEGWHLLNKLKAFVIRNGEEACFPACSITCAKSVVDDRYKKGEYDNSRTGFHADYPTIESLYQGLNIYYCYNDRFYEPETDPLVLQFFQ